MRFGLSINKVVLTHVYHFKHYIHSIERSSSRRYYKIITNHYRFTSDLLKATASNESVSYGLS